MENVRTTTKAKGRCGHTMTTTIYGPGLCRDRWIATRAGMLCNKCSKAEDAKWEAREASMKAAAGSRPGVYLSGEAARNFR